MVGKRLVNTGAAAPAVFDPLENFETVTYTGNGGTQKITGYIRKGAAFNGSSSYINLGNSIITGAFSLSFWVNTSNITTAKSVFDFENSTYDAESFIQNGIVYFRIYAGGTTYFFIQSTLGDISINTWHNITYVFPNTTVTDGCKIYIDGVEAASGTSSAGGLNLTSTIQRIGSRSSNTLYWLGKIDQVRIFNRALDSGEAGQLADEEYGDAENSVTDFFDDGSGVALYELDEDANDTDGVDGKFNNAAIFNSTNGRINTNLVPTYNSFTASLWLYIPTGQSPARIFNSLSTGLPNPMINTFYGNPLSDDLKVQIYDGTANVNVVKNNIPTDTWFHLAFSYTSGGLLKGYYNGVEFGSVSLATLTFTNTSPFYIGYDLRNTAYGFNGRADQVRMYSA